MAKWQDIRSAVNEYVQKLKVFVQQKKAQWTAYRAKRPRESLLLMISGGLALSGVLFVAGLWLLVWAGALGRLPSFTELSDIRNYNASEVFSADDVLLGKYFIENRTDITYDDLSPALVQGLIATEDARFFQHKGIDFRAWLRVFFKSILLDDESSGGGSTLSQQLAKNLYKRKRYWIFSLPVNKIREIITARRLEKLYTKNDLITLYLNTVPFSGNAFGVETAARQFFGKGAGELSTEEAAMLIGMLKGTSMYNPVNHYELARNRRNTVLGQMARYGYLESRVADSLQASDMEIRYTKESHNEGPATYFREFLRLQLEKELEQLYKLDGSAYNLYTDGLRIYTTLDSRIQHHAEKAVQLHLAELQKIFDKHWKGRELLPKALLEKLKKESGRYKKLKAKGVPEDQIDAIFDRPAPMIIYTAEGEQRREMSPMDSLQYYYSLLNAGFLAADPVTGNILAWVGGSEFKHFKYDHVLSKRQVGSTFKPIVYAEALRQRMEPCDYINNRLVTYTEYEDWQPHNADEVYGGAYSMQGGLVNSVNVVAVDLIMQTGVDSVIRMARRMGIGSPVPAVPSIALGTADLSLFEMVQAFSVFANRGKKVPLRYLLRIEDSNGKVLVDYSRPPGEETVLNTFQADLMNEMLQSVVDSGTARRLRYNFGLRGELAGKTGTTQSQADGWYLGYTPGLVAGAWVGGEYPSVRFRSLSLGQGATTALPIWGIFARNLARDRDLRQILYQPFPEPSPDVIDALDCPPYLEEEPDELLDLEEQLEGIFEYLRSSKGEGTDIEIHINESPKKIRIWPFRKKKDKRRGTRDGREENE